MTVFVKFGSSVMGLLFLLAVFVQFNDPDPFRWVLMYGAAAGACGLFLRGRLPLWFGLGVGVASGLWGGLLLPDAIGEVGLLELFQEVGMDSPEIEVGREAFGLLLIAAWMMVLVMSVRAESKRRAGQSGA